MDSGALALQRIQWVWNRVRRSAFPLVPWAILLPNQAENFCTLRSHSTCSVHVRNFQWESLPWTYTDSESVPTHNKRTISCLYRMLNSLSFRFLSLIFWSEDLNISLVPQAQNIMTLYNVTRCQFHSFLFEITSLTNFNPSLLWSFKMPILLGEFIVRCDFHYKAYLRSLHIDKKEVFTT